MSQALPVVDVFVPRRGGKLWSYSCQGLESLIRPGQLATVPFARQRLLAVLASEIRHEPTPIKGIRQLLDVHDVNIFPPDLWQTLTWIERYYLISRGRALESLITIAHWRLDKNLGTPTLLKTAPEYFCAAAGQSPKLKHAKTKAAWQLFKSGPTSSVMLANIYANPTAIMRDWLAKGYIAPTLPPKPDSATPQPLQLNHEQKETVAQISRRLGQGSQIHLLFGVTGSGKTEVYGECIRQCLNKGQSALVLAPEIALVPTLVNRLRLRLGQDVFAWHSALNEGDRAASQRALDRGEPTVLVGARSALFAPIRNLGLVVIDEEHDSGLQLSEGPTINIRDAAIQRAKFAGALAILGSATPSLELYQRAISHEGVTLHRLTERATKADMARVDIVDCSQSREAGALPWLTKTLENAIAERLKKREQVILFRNRRGYHPVLLCSACKNTVDCPACSTSLTLHARPVLLRCHLCGFSQLPPTACPHCQANRLKPLGTGTQRITADLAGVFPDARIERLDRDRVTSQSRLEAILARMAAGEIDILVGTQMVTKGMDVANVTLAGVINIDGLLHQPDFRASEQCFQHLCQVAGRSGRGHKPGQVIVQTWHPQHPVILAATSQDYPAFARVELSRRKEGAYPPFSRLVRLLWQSENARAVETSARAALAATPVAGLQVLGPAPCPLERINHLWRWHAIARSDNLNALRRWALAAQAVSHPVPAEIQIDPYHLS